jgi:hypothetical protein
MTRLRTALAQFLRHDQSGSSTVEFVLVFPAFILIFISSFEAAMLMTRQVMLDRAIDMSVRDLRLGTGTLMTHGMVRNKICNDARLLPDCRNSLLVELTRVSMATYAMPATGTPCIDKINAITPVTAFANGAVNELMLIRVCYAVAPFFPTSGLGLELTKDTEGMLYMTAVSAFVNEPV